MARVMAARSKHQRESMVAAWRQQKRRLSK